MKIIRAKHMGYCMGVQNAIKTAEHFLQTESQLYSHGLLIHNQQELERLAKSGLKVMNDQQDVSPDATVLIRAHGIHPQVRQDLKQTGVQLIDATCPLVLRNQKRTLEKDKEGFQVIIAGHDNHAEIQALVGFATDPILVQNLEDAQNLVVDTNAKYFLLAQTTLRPAVFAEIEKVLRQKIPQLEVFNSICSATQERQKAIETLAKEVDVICVVGDKKSANSLGLVEKARSCGKPAFLLSTPADITPEIKSYEIIGLTAAASAPSWLIDEVEQAFFS